MARPNELLLIQIEEDDRGTYEIPELGITETTESPEVALSVALEKIRSWSVSTKRYDELKAEIDVLEDRIQDLRKKRVAIIDANRFSKKIQAKELLEQIPMCERYIRWFGIDHPLEQVFGDVKCLGFIIGKDVDNDGDKDCAPTIYSTRQIAKSE